MQTSLFLNPKLHFTRQDLRELARGGEGWRLSLYEPLARTGRELREGPILLKDARTQADSALRSRGADEALRGEILDPIDRILDDSGTAWLQGGTLAVFSEPGRADVFLLPVDAPPLVEVDRHFFLEPLLPLLFEDGRFHLLALSLKRVRLWEAGRAGMREIPLEGIPTSLVAAEGFEDSESYLSFHTRTAPPGAGMRPPMYYGQGGGKGDLKEMKRDILDFFHQIDRGVRALVAGPGPALPLMIAAVEMLPPIFREASSHPRILAQTLAGNPDLPPPDELHARAWALFAEEYARERAAALERYREGLFTGRTASGVTDVLPLAAQGGVDTLFLRRGYRRPGRFDPASGKAEPAEAGADTEDLANLACVHALLGDGKVYALEAAEMPPGADLAALTRF
jgi:hypothetical protein